MSYETVTLDSIVRRVLRLDGQDPDDASDADKIALVGFIASRLETAEEYYRWPVLSTIEGRYYRDAWAAGTYEEDDEVWHADTEAYYRATTSTTEEPAEDASDWTILGDFNRYVAWEQTGATAIGACLRAWDKDPRENTDALEIPFEIRAEGIVFAPDEVDHPYLEIRMRVHDLHAETYSSTDNYAAGDRVYYTDGEVYRVVSATNAGDTPENAPAKFEVLTIPRFLARALEAGALADWRTNDERDAGAAPWDDRFTELLDEQVWQLTKLQGQTGRVRFAAS